MEAKHKLKSKLKEEERMASFKRDNSSSSEVDDLSDFEDVQP